jgi:hypothetical protein
VLPISLKYRCVRDPCPAIAAGLSALEDALSLPRAPGSHLYQRLRRVGERVLGQMEVEFGLQPASGADLRERIQGAKVHVLNRVAREVGVSRPGELSMAEQMRCLFNAVHEFAGQFADATDDYGRRQHERRLIAAQPLLLDLRRVHNFLVVTDGYVAEQMTGERFLDVLGRLEREVLGKVRHGVPREAVVRLAPPVDLGIHYEEYRQSRRKVVVDVTAQVEGSVRKLLAELSQIGTVIKG